MNHAWRYQVWWIAQIPGPAFIVPVANFVEAKLVMDALANYDKWQYDHRIKPDYSNAGGLHEWDGEEFTDWHPSETESAILARLFGEEFGWRDDPLDWLTLEHVRQFQEELDKAIA